MLLRTAVREELRRELALACMTRAAQADQKHWDRFFARYRAALQRAEPAPVQAQDDLKAVERLRKLTMTQRAKYGAPSEVK